MSLFPPPSDWYSKKIAKDEKMWIALSAVVCVVMFAWMIVWHVYGKQNPSSETYKTTPQEFTRLHEAFVSKYQIGEENGIPVVLPDPGGNIFVLAQMWRWSPVIILKKDEWYKFHISSVDLLHGFSIQPVNMNFMVTPGYDYVLKFKPTETGEFKVICNEFCGIGHHMMIGKIVVIENDNELEKYGYKKEFINKGNEIKTASLKLSGDDLVLHGQELFKKKACNSCHSVDGSKLVGPSFKGIDGRTSTVIENGEEKTVTVNDDYIRRSIKEPLKQVVKDFPASMPPQSLSDEEINAVISYLKTLK